MAASSIGGERRGGAVVVVGVGAGVGRKEGIHYSLCPLREESSSSSAAPQPSSEVFTQPLQGGDGEGVVLWRFGCLLLIFSTV